MFSRSLLRLQHALAPLPLRRHVQARKFEEKVIPMWATLFSGSRSKLEISPSRALKNKLNLLILTYIRNEYKDFKLPQLCQAYVILSRASSQLRSQAQLSSALIYSHILRNFEASIQKKASLEVILKTQKRIFPDQDFSQEEKHLIEIQAFSNVHNYFCLLEAVLLSQTFNERIKVELEKTILPIITKQLQEQTKELPLSDSRQLALKKLLLCEYYSIAGLPDSNKLLSSSIQVSQDDSPPLKKGLVEFLLDFEEDHAADSTSPFLLNFNTDLPQFHNIPVLSLTLRAFHCLANLDLEALKANKRLLSKFGQLSEADVFDLFKSQVPINPKAAAIPQVNQAIYRTVRSSLDSYHHRKLKLEDTLPDSFESAELTFNMLNLLLANAQDPRDLTSQLGLFVEIASEHFNEKLEQYCALNEQEETPGEALSLVSDKLDRAKLLLLKLLKLLTTYNIKSAKLNRDLSSWVKYYMAQFHEEHSLAERLYILEIMLDMDEEESQGFFHSCFEDQMELCLHHLYSMSGLLDSSIKLQFQQQPSASTGGGDFVLTKYFRSPVLARQSLPQYIQTLSQVLVFFKLLTKLDAFSSSQVQAIFNFFSLTSQSKEAQQLLREAALSGQTAFELTLQVSNVLSRVLHQFLQAKEEEFFTNAKASKTILSLLFQKKEGEQSEQESKEEQEISVQGVSSFIQEVGYLESYIGLIKRSKGELKEGNLVNFSQSFPQFIESSHFESLINGSDQSYSKIREILFTRETQEDEEIESLERNYQILSSPLVSLILERDVKY